MLKNEVDEYLNLFILILQNSKRFDRKLLFTSSKIFNEL